MIIHAVSIHSGGGKVLLDQLLLEKTFGEVKVLICDTRYDPPQNLDDRIKIFPIKASLRERIKAEYLLEKISKQNPEETILCFSNLPPLFKLPGKVVLYLQNALLLPRAPHFYVNIKTALRFTYEKIWLKLFWKNIDEAWVQTQWMKKSLESYYSTPVQVIPIIPTFDKPLGGVEKKFDYITVTGSAPHKKLLKLLKSWERLTPPYPSLLVITDTPSQKIAAELNKLKD